MLKRLLIISGCVACAVASVLFFTNSKPPALEWHDMSCWNNSTFQVLRNVRPLTEELLRARREAKKNNEHSKYEVLDDGSVSLFMTRYVDLLEIVYDLQNKDLTDKERQALEEKRRKLHRQSCVYPMEYGKGNSPMVFISFFLQSAPEAEGKFSKSFQQLLYFLFSPKSNPNFVPLWPTPEQNFADFASLPSYLAFEMGDMNAHEITQALGGNMKFLDISPYVSETLKKQGATYELIGMACATPSHVWAYVKDQFEDNPQWWKVDDYKKIVERKEPPITETELQNDGANFIYILIYKRIIPGNNAIDKLAQALGSIQ